MIMVLESALNVNNELVQNYDNDDICEPIAMLVDNTEISSNKEVSRKRAITDIEGLGDLGFVSETSTSSHLFGFL
jgi:hypothetical protein